MQDLYNLLLAHPPVILQAGHAEAGDEPQGVAAGISPVCVLYVQAGEGAITLTSGQADLRAGYVYLLPPQSILAADGAASLRYDFVHLHADAVTDHLFSLLIPTRALPMEQSVATYLFGEVARHHALSSATCRMRTQAALSLILSHFLAGMDPALDEQDLAKFLPLFEAIDRHAGEMVDLGEVAERLQMNRVYVSNLFKRTFGISPQQYLQGRRLDHARRLLADRSLPISQIADHLGFYDPAAFTSFFRKYTGMTPKEYRSRLS